MPRKQQRKQPKPPDDDGALEVEGLGLDEIEDLTAFLDMTDGLQTVDIARLQTNGDKAVCETVAFDVLREDPAKYIREKWGAGKYKLRLKNEQRQYIRGRTIVIAEAFRSAFQNGGLGAPPATGGDLVQVYRDMLTNQTQLLQTAIASRGGGGDNLEKLVVGLAGLLKPPPPPPPQDMAALFANMASTFRSLMPEPAAKENALDQLDGVLKIAERINSGKNEDWVGVAREVGGKLAEAIPKLAAPARPQLPASGAAPAAGAAAPADEPEEEDVKDAFERALRDGILFLNARANTKTPEEWASYLFEGQDLPTFNAVLHAIQQGGTVAHLLDFEPSVKPNEEWFVKLHAAIKQQFAENSKGS